MDKNMNNVKLYSPLVLAYVGDSVYEVYVRDRVLAEHTDMPAYKLHKISIKYVKAEAQAKSIHAIEGLLTEDELSVYKRGRNALYLVCSFSRRYLYGNVPLPAGRDIHNRR